MKFLSKFNCCFGILIFPTLIRSRETGHPVYCTYRKGLWMVMGKPYCGNIKCSIILTLVLPPTRLSVLIYRCPAVDRHHPILCPTCSVNLSRNISSTSCMGMDFGTKANASA